jgi:hypothetical protein
MMNPWINGVAYGYAEIAISVDGFPFTGVSAINYKTSMSRGVVRGTSARKLGLTTGDADCEADLEFTMDDYRAFLSYLGDGYLKRIFSISVSYSNDDGVNLTPALTYTDRILGCRLKGTEHSHSQGADGLKVKVPLDVMQILEDVGGGILVDGLGTGIL